MNNQIVVIFAYLIFFSKDQKFVRISEKFELTNIELSDGFC